MAGDFIITTDGAAGSVSGEYKTGRRGNEIEMNLHPNKGWISNEKRLILRLLFMIVKVFNDWPKSYEWNAVIKSDYAKNPFMN